MSAATGSATREAQRDFDLHGVVGVRLIGASGRESSAAAARLGGMTRPLSRTPDVVVRFVPQVAMRDLAYVELGRNGFTDDGFFLLSDRRRPVRVRLPFGADGITAELVCERGGRSIPFLDALLKLAAVRNGYAPVHASAFEIGGVGVLVAGWAHGGKTSCLLAFAQTGATFLSDDLVLLRGDGRAMFGLRTPLSLSDWQLAQLSGVRAGRARRAVCAGARRLERMLPGTGASGTVRMALAAVPRRLKVSLPPEAVFRRVGDGAAEPRTVFLTFSHAAADIRVQRVDPETVAAQLTTALRAEFLSLFAQYLAFRFAFPTAVSDWFEQSQARAAELLRGALGDKDVFTVRHPHPVSLRELHDAMRPFVESGRHATTVPARSAR